MAGEAVELVEGVELELLTHRTILTFRSPYENTV
jgi:hypothetical protein